MSAKTGQETGDHSSKQPFSNALASSSTSSIPNQSNNGQARQRANARGTSAKYYDIASTILGGLGDMEEVYLNAAKNGNFNKLEQLLEQKNDIGLDIDCKDKRTGNTALIWAAKRGHSKIVELLLRYGADATLCNYEAQTALETAFSPIKTILLDWVDKQEEFGNQHLLLAAWQGNFSAIRKILTKGRNLNMNCQNADGLTPLMLVCRDVQLMERFSTQFNRYYSPVQVTQELLSAKANIHVTDNDNRSCLHYASQSRASCADGLITALISGGMDVEFRDKRLLTPLHLASQLGNTNNVVALADGGSNVNVQGFAGLTPLHMTAYNDHQKTAATLLNHGADVTVTDDRGLTPVDLAKTRRMKNMLQEAWTEATKGNNSDTPNTPAKTKVEDTKKKKAPVNQKKRPEVIIDEVVSSSSKAPGPSQTASKTSQNKVLSNVEKCKQAEKKILQEVEAFKAAHPVLQRETTRMLGTSRSKVLPQIGRSTSPDQSSSRSQGSLERNRSPSRGSDEVHRSLEDARMQLISRGRSVSDIKLGVGRQSEMSGMISLDEDGESAEGRSSRLCRTSPIPREFVLTGRGRHQRSDSDPATPSLKDLAASCENILPNTKGRRVVRPVHQHSTSGRGPTTSNIFITQKNTNLTENGRSSPHMKGMSNPEEEMLRSMESPFELVRCRSILKDEFILEESRPREMGSGSEPMSSTSSSSLSSSPREASMFLQSSRSLRHDPSLSTLLEQQATTSFSNPLLDSLNNTEGMVRPLIRNPQQRLRRKSENSLSSSTDFDVDLDLRRNKPLTRSHSLRKSDERGDKVSPVSSIQLAVHKSQSLECISPRTQLAASTSQSALQISSTAKSSSDGNLESSQKKTLHGTKSDPVQNFSQPKPTQSKSFLIPSEKMPSSKQWAVEPFSGKARIVASTAMDGWDSLSSSASREASAQTSKPVIAKSVVNSPTKSSQNPATSNTRSQSGTVDTQTTKSCSGVLTQHKVQDKILQNQERPQTVAETRPVVASREGGKTENSHHSLVHSPVTTIQSKQSTSNTSTQNSSAKKSISVNSSILHSKSDSNLSARTVSTSTSSISNQAKENKVARQDTGICFVVTEESQRQGSASKQKLEERMAASQAKQKETGSIKQVIKRQNSDNGPGDVKNRSVMKAASIEKNIMKNQPKPAVNPSQGKGKVGKVSTANSSSISRNTSSESLSASSTSETKSGLAKDKKSVETKTTANTTVRPASKTVPVKDTTQKTTTGTTGKVLPKDVTSKPAQATAKLPVKTQEASKADANKSSTVTAAKGETCQASQPKEPLVKTKLQSQSSPTSARLLTETASKQGPEAVMSTPVIVNPFEEFVQAHIKVIENTTSDAVVKTKKMPSKSTQKNQKRTTNSAGKRPNSGTSRQTSAGKKRGGKGKDSKSEKEARPKSGGKKSGKNQSDKKAKGDDTIETEVSAEAAKPDTAIISGIGWQLSASCVNTSDIKVSKDVHFHISDSEFSGESDVDDETSRQDIMRVTEEAAKRHLLEAFKDKITEHSPRFHELKRHESSMANMNLPVVDDDGYPPMNLDMTQNLPKDFDHIHHHAEMDDVPGDLSAMDFPGNNAIQRDIFMGKLTPIPEASLLSRTANAISAFDNDFKGSKLSLLLDGNPIDDENNNSNNNNAINNNNSNSKHGLGHSNATVRLSQTSESLSKHTTQKHINTAASQDYEEHPCSDRDEDENRLVYNYEYTPTGKVIRRTQSLKDFQNPEKQKREYKFSESRSHRKEKQKEKGEDNEEDIDDVIDEILSSTTSSLTSTLKNVNHVSGVHTLTEGDRSLLLKMSSSQTDSPFHAHSLNPSQAQPQASEAVLDMSDITKSKSSTAHTPRQQSSATRDMKNIRGSKNLTEVTSTHESQQHGSIASSIASKPPMSVRSSLKEERSPHKTPLVRSVSNRERRRQAKDMLGHTITDEEAKQLAKVINSFKHMELHASAHRTEGFGGSAKSPGRNNRSSMGTADLRPASTNASFRSKGKFQELKDDTSAKISIDVKDAHASGATVGKRESGACGISQEEDELLKHLSNADLVSAAVSIEPPDLPFEGRRGSIASSVGTVDSTKSGTDDTIQWKKGNVLGRGAFGTVHRCSVLLLRVIHRVSKLMVPDESWFHILRVFPNNLNFFPLPLLIPNKVWCGLTNEGQLIAVKQIELTTMEKTKAQHEYEKVQEEVELLKTLEHVNIVSYLGTSLEDNVVSIFMQFIPGGSIASILARFGALDESVFRRYTKQILQGVEYLHDNDVIHRDLKGANVMLMPNGVIKLIDFGCAKRLCINLNISQTEILKSMKGTPFWMAPEVVNETGHGKKSDIWSVGCTIFEMATRKPPWADMNPMAAIFAIGSPSRPVPTLDDKFTPEAREFVSLCLTRDQNKRPGASELLDHPFITRRTAGRSSRIDS